MSLDIPFYRTFPVSGQVVVDQFLCLATEFIEDVVRLYVRHQLAMMTLRAAFKAGICSLVKRTEDALLHS